MQIPLLSTALALCTLPFTHAQQFGGSTVANSLPYVYGAELAYFNILDTNKKNTTLVNYSSLGSFGQRLTPSNVKRAVIFIHGELRDPYLYMTNLLTAFGTRDRSDVTLDNVQMVTPYFTNGDDKGVGYPWDANATHGSTSDCLVWSGSGWMNGTVNQYPWNKKSVSSFAVLDQMIQYFDNKTLFPNMQQIVVGGHSAGGQTTQRYVMVGNQLKTKSPVHYYVANPNSYGWFSDDRPLDTSSCPTYDFWKEGLSNYTNTYGATLVASGRAAVLANARSKTVHYGRGLLDVYDDSSTCAPFTSGLNRNERFFNYIKEFPVYAPSTIDYVNVAHDAYGMMSSVAGMNRLFYDNFSGDGSKLYDYGCPRQQLGDDPFPDPTCGITKPIADAGVFNGWQYEGCFTDLYGQRTLSDWQWSNANTTIQTCTSECASLGYTIAGLEYGNECFCGNTIATQSFGPLVEVACGMSCAGNSSQICGDSNRLSVFSFNSTLVASNSSIPIAGNATTSALPIAGNATTSVTSATTSSIPFFSNTTTNTFVPTSSTGSSTVSSTVSVSATMSISNSTSSSSTSSTASTTISTSSTTSATSSSTTSSTPSSTPLACPSSNATLYTTPSGTFQIACFVDSMYSDLTTSAVAAGTLESCLASCAALSACQGVSFLPSSGQCWMKSALNSGTYNTAVWGAKRVSTSSTSTATSSSSASSSSSSASVAKGSATTSSSSSTTTTTASATPSSPYHTPTLPSAFSPLGCYIDTTARLLPYQVYTSTSNTPNLCASACAKAGFAYAGSEYADECWCGNSLASAAKTQDSECNWGCWGDNSVACGGEWRVSVWGPAQ